MQVWAKSIKPFKIYNEMKYLTFDFDLWPWGQGHKIKFFIKLFMIIISCKFEQNRWSRSGFIAKWIIWPLILTFDLGVKVTKFCCFYLPLNFYYMVQIWEKLIKPFRICCKMKYLKFDFDLWPLGQGHKFCFFYLTLYGYYMVQISQNRILKFVKIVWNKLCKERAKCVVITQFKLWHSSNSQYTSKATITIRWLG